MVKENDFSKQPSPDGNETIVLDDEKALDVGSERKPEVFKFDDEKAPNVESERKPEVFKFGGDEVDSPPESITDGERLPHVSDYSGIHLESLPIKGLKTFVYSILALVLVIISWESYELIKFALEINWFIAILFGGLIAGVVIQSIRLLWVYLTDKENLGKLESIRNHANRLKAGHDFGNSSKLILELNTFYASKPQAAHLSRCLDQLPDYSNDREAVDHVNKLFLHPLDEEAKRRISKQCLQSGVLVGLSPWPGLDMAFALWRSVKMINDVAQVYGLRPSIRNRYKLIKMVIHKIAFVGVSQVVADQFIQGLGLSKVGASIGQGVGAGIYSARIGIAAIKLTRPFEFEEGEEPSVWSLFSVNSFKAAVSPNETTRP